MLSVVPTNADCAETVIDLRHQELVLTLLRHCQSMKRQETRLRLATFFMILMGFAVIFFLHYQKRSSTSDEPITAAQSEPIAQVQREPWSRQMFSFDLFAVPINSNSSGSSPALLQWRNSSTPNITSVLIPTSGLYFVYLDIPYRVLDRPNNCIPCLTVEVTKFGRAYPRGRKALFFRKSINCEFSNFGTVHIGRLMKLKANDKLEVTASSSKLLDWYNGNLVLFGGYLVHDS